MKDEWFKQEKKEFFKGKPKKDSSGKGLRLNKGRGGCPITKQEKIGKGKSKDEFTPEKVLKTAGGLAILGVGIHLATELID